MDLLKAKSYILPPHLTKVSPIYAVAGRIGSFMRAAADVNCDGKPLRGTSIVILSGFFCRSDTAVALKHQRQGPYQYPLYHCQNLNNLED